MPRNFLDSKTEMPIRICFPELPNNTSAWPGDMSRRSLGEGGSPRFLTEPYEKPGPRVKNSAGWANGAGQAGLRGLADGSSPPLGASFKQTGYAAKSGSFA